MKLNIFLDNGYLDMKSIIDTGYPFIWVIGARATGKTYGALSVAIKREKKFILMRRTQAQTDLINKEDFSPFKKINEDQGTDIHVKPVSKYSSGIYDDSDNMRCLGYTAALSTFSNMRGFDASDCDLIIYDEAIPERHERPIKNESDALWNLYESCNRNRDINGGKPIQLLMLANSNRADNPYFLSLGLITAVEKMKSAGRTTYEDKERGILIINVENSPISEMKKDTALYRLTKGSDFEKMALSNDFAFDDFSGIDSRNLKEYKPYLEVGEIFIYKHKSKREYYFCQHRSGSPTRYGTTERELAAFRKDNLRLWFNYLGGYCVFENYLTKTLFLRYITG